MITKTQLVDAIGAKVAASEVVEVRRDVFRAELMHEGKPYAIHYFDLTNAFMQDSFDVRSYQTDVMAKDYYDHPGPLQWNFYYDFVIEDSELFEKGVQEAKREIEGDLVFARKSVTPVSEIRRYFAPISLAKGGVPEDFKTVWEDTLEDHGLSSVLDQSLSMDGVVEAFVSENETARSPGRPIAHSPVPTWRTIEQLTLMDFRPYPVKREFSLAKVNLIEGPNASGKTSLLEALELLVCGRTLRAADQIQDFRFRATINGKRVEMSRLPDAKYRDRDAAWYSRSYRQGNNLATSFARFNFFDSDAAYRFSEDIGEGQVSKALKEIVFGSEAAKLEVRIAAIQERFKTAYRRDLKSAEELRAQLTQQHEVVDLHRKQVASNIGIAVVKERLAGLGFQSHVIESSLEDVIRSIGLVKYAAGALVTMTSPVGKYTVRDSLAWQKELEVIREEFERCKARINELERNSREVGRNLEIITTRRTAIGRLREYINTRAFDVLDDKNAADLRGVVARGRIVVRLLSDLPRSSEADRKLVPLDTLLLTVGDDIEALEKQIRNVSADIARLDEGRNEVQRLVEDVRVAGKRILGVRPDTAVCPLCGVDHGPQDLKRRIDELGERRVGDPPGGEQTRSQLAELSSRSRLLESARTRLLALKGLATQIGLDASTSTIDQVIDAAERIKSNLLELESRLADFERKAEEILAAGFSQQDLEQHGAALGIEVNVSLDVLEAALSQIESDSKEDAERERLRKILADIDVTKGSLMEILSRAEFSGGMRTNTAAGAPPSSGLSETIEALKQSLLAIEKCGADISIRPLDDLVKLSASLDEIQRVSADIQATEATSVKLKEAESRVKEVDKRFKDYQSRAERGRIGESVLDELLKQSPLAKRLEFFFRSSGDAVRDTFLRIHSPREFMDVALSDDAIVLTRTDGTKATAKELSTGQRSALALSLFLTMHSMLKSGPHILLFDDPVVYVDDLNTLSFLDLIRELAMQGESQIFFATANSKISALMKAKCLPLSDHFQSIALDRESPSQDTTDEVVH